ncbi:MAG: chemotaxis protein CheW [Clostridium sp.]|uniref:chemotaxis protein CheW n=1 Tax=Clostridium sp. TaxID=1506 RepID=UPI003F313BE1
MESNLKVLIFGLNGEYFATDIGQVERIIGYDKPTKIPEAPSFVEGVIKHEERIVPIINMNEKFCIEDNKEENKKIIIIKREEKKFGIIVENVYEVKDIKDEEIEEAPEIVSNIRGSYIKGIVKLDERIIILLDLEKILKREDEEKIF